MQVKHVMWALAKVFEFFVTQQRFAPGNILIEIPPIRLGVGNVKYVPLDHASNTSIESMSDASPGRLNSTFSLPVRNIAVLPDPGDMQGSGGNARTALPFESVRKKKATDVKGRKEVFVDLSFRPNAHTFPDYQIINASLDLLIRAAQPIDMNEAIGPLFSTYNDVVDFTMSLVPQPYVKSNLLSWLDCINSINGIATAMAEEGPEGKWEELDASIRDNQLVIGRFCIDKGDWTYADPDALCIREERDRVGVQ